MSEDATFEQDDDGSSGLAAERAHRLAKLDALRAKGIEPYPYRFDRSTTLGELRAAHGQLAPGTETDTRVAVAGRLLLIRRQGKLTFATMRDRSDQVQLFVSRATLGDEAHEAFDDLDLGDWVGVEGTVMTTRKGELSVKVDRFQLLAKALRPLPDKWKGLTDTDQRFRQRYVDLIVNEEARRTFEVRHTVLASLRRTLGERGFVEIEGPVLQVEPGGAHARPFVTHHNALDQQMYLRIALELHLKRLIVGGMERVFELGRVFRNEGVSTRHNPEFTMLEAYQAFADYTDIMELTQSLIVGARRS
jgi:lysyl-tRNA synthetase, class II